MYVWIPTVCSVYARHSGEYDERKAALCYHQLWTHLFLTASFFQSPSKPTLHFTKSHSWMLGVMSAHFQLGWLCNTIIDPTNNLNQLFTSAVILRPACDCCWQVGEQRETGNELNHLLTLKITNWKVLGPGVKSIWLLQMREWEFSKERAYLKEFSKIQFWCHGKTLISVQSYWLLVLSSRRHIRAKNYNLNTVVQNQCNVHALSISWKQKTKKKQKRKGTFYCIPLYMVGPVIDVFTDTMLPICHNKCVS